MKCPPLALPKGLPIRNSPPPPQPRQPPLRPMPGRSAPRTVRRRMQWSLAAGVCTIGRGYSNTPPLYGGHGEGLAWSLPNQPAQRHPRPPVRRRWGADAISPATARYRLEAAVPFPDSWAGRRMAHGSCALLARACGSASRWPDSQKDKARYCPLLAPFSTRTFITVSIAVSSSINSGVGSSCRSRRL